MQEIIKNAEKYLNNLKAGLVLRDILKDQLYDPSGEERQAVVDEIRHLEGIITRMKLCQ